MTYEQGMKLGKKMRKEGATAQQIALRLKREGVTSRAGTNYTPMGALRAIGRAEAERKRNLGKRK
jgi:hypothetical protein